MATVILDMNREYIWQVDDTKLNKVLEYVMRHIDSTSAFHDLLYSSKTYGNLEFFQLGDLQQQTFEDKLKQLHSELASKHAGLSEGSEEQKALSADIKMLEQLLSMISFAKANDLAGVE